MKYSADFETTTDINDCRVWAWGVCEISDYENKHFGNSIESFLDFCKENKGEYYFHNAGFDCEFILNYLLHNGYEYSNTLEEKTFKPLISAQGKFYQLDVCFDRNKKSKKTVKCVFKDSLKKLPMSVNSIAKSFKLPISKLKIDYHEYRSKDHELTELEKEYLSNDVEIVARALDTQFKQGLSKLTIGADALSHYKDILGDRWNTLFPRIHIEMDAMIRKAYRGGWTYANPKFQADAKNPNRVNGSGSVYDVNSLYPYVMYSKPLPAGMPIYFRGQYETDDEHPLYIQYITCHCKLKKDKLPTLQIKNNPFYMETEYVTDTEGSVELALTNIDLELLREQYDVTILSYNGGYKFASIQGIFNDYIDYWMDIKTKSTGGLRQLAKLMLNSLYGKFATNPDVTGKIPYLKEDGSTGYKLGEKETREPVYTPMGCFITAWARRETITTAQRVYHRFMYADTDSVHVLGTEPISGIEIHPTKMGAWKHESDFSRGKYLRAKTYMEEITHEGELVDGEYKMVVVETYIDVKCAGMPDTLKKEVTFKNFKRGLVLEGKLRPKHVKGGIVLVPTSFKLTA